MRQHRADSLFKAGRDVIGLMTTIAERLDLAYEALIALTWSEISESLLSDRLCVDAKTIAARQVGYGILLIDGTHSFITGEELAREIAALPAAESEARQLQGDIAFPGRYRGPAKIVTIPDEIGKVCQGDVLVSPSTDPYYVPAMVRAGAIVTDEGGILSHAAIVSRELGIPCVIGTRIATTMLEDGVLVDVDATGDTGQVSIVAQQERST